MRRTYAGGLSVAVTHAECVDDVITHVDVSATRTDETGTLYKRSECDMMHGNDTRRVIDGI